MSSRRRPEFPEPPVVRQGLRDRTRAAVKDQIADLALRLFVERGFDQTTVEDIAAAAGISPRSFYRYFGTKEGVVVDFLADEGRVTLALLERRPTSEPPWDALIAALTTLVEQVEADADRHLPTTRLLLGSRALRSVHLDKQAAWQDMLAPALAERLDLATGARRDVAARALAGSALACLDSAFTAWASLDATEPLSDLFSAAAAAVRP